MADKPLFALDVIAPRKILLKHLGYDWDESFNDFLVFRDYLLDKIATDPDHEDVRKMDARGYSYYFNGSTCCGINQLSLPQYDGKTFAKALLWGVTHLPANFIYWGGENFYTSAFKLLEEFGFTFTRRPYNLVHNHFLREYQISYDYADQGDKAKNSKMLVEKEVSTEKNDEIAYYGYKHSDFKKRRPPVTRVPNIRKEPDVVEEPTLPEMPLAG